MEIFVGLGLRQSALDPCVFYYRSADGTLGGLIGTEVDDLLIAGTAEFHTKVLKLIPARLFLESGKAHEQPKEFDSAADGYDNKTEGSMSTRPPTQKHFERRRWRGVGAKKWKLCSHQKKCVNTEEELAH